MPYQLHCAPLVLQTLDELDKAMLLDERLDDNTLDDERNDDGGAIDEDERSEDERTDEDGANDEATLDLTDADELLPPQIAPVTTGVSIAPLPFTCIPNEIVWPG